MFVSMFQNIFANTEKLFFRPSSFGMAALGRHRPKPMAQAEQVECEKEQHHLSALYSTPPATPTLGLLCRRAKSSDELREIYKAIEALEPIEQDPEIYRPTKSLYYWPLSVALVLSLIFAAANPTLISRVTYYFRHFATQRSVSSASSK